MPHHARIVSASGYYHVVPKGIANQIIFSDDDDKLCYLELLKEAKAEHGLKIHAYCLMSNHVHLVIEDERNELGESMKYVHERYATQYAGKIGRQGGVFRKPYWSEPIEDDARLLCAVRYVHNNPAAAGICKASQYRWSSVQDYLGRSCGVTDTAVVLDMLGGREGFIEFSRSDAATAMPFEGSKLRSHLSDDEALRLAMGIMGHDPRTNASLETAHLLKSRGFSQLQIMRLTGLGKSQVIRA